MRLLVAVFVTFLALLASCSLASTGDPEPKDEGKPSGSTCPDGSTLTYENFARPFMQNYCVRCHSSTLTGDARNGAPEFHDFDSEEGILAVANHVDEKAAAGPDAINKVMPKNGPAPTEEERRMLGEWLACERAEAPDGGSSHHPEDAGH